MANSYKRLSYNWKTLVFSVHACLSYQGTCTWKACLYILFNCHDCDLEACYKKYICLFIKFYFAFNLDSAADLYIKDFLHPYVMDGNLDARPLRILYRHRWIQTVPETVLQYCIQEMTGPLAGSFRAPTVEDVQKHRVVITTLSTARLLSDLELPVGE